MSLVIGSSKKKYFLFPEPFCCLDNFDSLLDIYCSISDYAFSAEYVKHRFVFRVWFGFSGFNTNYI